MPIPKTSRFYAKAAGLFAFAITALLLVTGFTADPYEQNATASEISASTRQALAKVETDENGFLIVKDLPEPVEEVSEPEHAEYYLDVSYHGASQAAINTGGIVEFYEAWYASHNYDEGGLFYEFEPGDIVHIDGRDVVIEGLAYFNYSYNSAYDVRGTVGYDKVIFQTCIGNTSDCTFWYGYEIGHSGWYPL